jgi:CRP/FNR family transcriptional regulator
MADEKTFLRNTLLFHGVSDSELEKVAQAASEKKFGKHQVVFKEGEAGNALYIIKKGLVKISKGSTDGRAKTLALLKPGEVFGEMSVLSDEKRTATAETMLECSLLVIEKAAALALLKKNPDISLQIIRTLIERLSQADRQIKNLALGNSRAKVADILLFLVEQFGQGGKNATKVMVKLTHQEIADLAGLARETTTKLLNEFVKDDAIALADREIEILSVAKLREWVM